MTRPMLSVLILTRNEEKDLPGCLESVAWSDDVHVLDSFSTDRTVEIAKSHHATVTQRAFTGYASQRNFGLGQLAYRHPWVLMLDADERVPDGFVAELTAFAANAPEDVAAGRFRRRDYAWGRWLKHAQISPFYVRLLRPGRVRVEREINEVIEFDGEVRDLRGHIDHFPFSKGIGHWIDRHNTYSRMEAELICSRQGIDPSWRTALFGSDFNERRRHQKALFYRMPARPLLKLCYMLFFRRAILDGWPGIRYSLLQAIYEYMIVLKVIESEADAAARSSRG